MGCVLGTPAADAHLGPSGPTHRRRTTDHLSHIHAVNKHTTSLQNQGVRQDLDSCSVERRRPSPGLCHRNEQGWPSWLLAVAGEVIQGWTPRRANTFEKLAKVCLPRVRDRFFFLTFFFSLFVFFCLDSVVVEVCVIFCCCWW